MRLSESPASSIFEGLGIKTSHTDRVGHIKRLYDILHLCLQSGDVARARRAWGILTRCKETNWESLWRTGLRIILEHGDGSEIAYLRTVKLRLPAEVKCTVQLTATKAHAQQSEVILKETILHHVRAGKWRDALDDLEV